MTFIEEYCKIGLRKTVVFKRHKHCLSICILKKKPIHELVVAAAGPCVNLIITVFCIALYVFLKIDAGNYASVNMYMLIINLLPVVPLDGGRILNAYLMLELKNKKADKIPLCTCR